MGDERHRPEFLELLRKVAEGDRVAFSELYDLISPRIFGLSHRLLRDAATAERATRESFVEIWQRAPQYDASTTRPVTWMLGIALRHARALVRIALRAELPSRKIA